MNAYQAHTATSRIANGVAAAGPKRHEEASPHYRCPHERPFTRAERERVVILVNSVTQWHDPLIQAALAGLGYRVEALPVPTKADYQAGREFGNNGMCNPAYFTIGALLNHLGRLRDVEGLSADEIARDYVFVTAGSCGPCRYGMYESEARLALSNGGFEGFRVLTFQQQAGLAQSGRGGGIDYNLPFALALLNAVILGDLFNELAFQMRPYEVERGRVDEALGGIVGRVAEGLRHPARPGILARLLGWLLHPLAPEVPAIHLARLFSYVRPRPMERLLRECAAQIRETVEVDCTRVKPLCKIVGEFFSQMTEGDGNFRMFAFLEENGAEVLPEPLTTWICYLLNMRDFQLGEDARITRGIAFRTSCKRARLRVARWLIEHVHARYRRALGDTARPIPALERLAQLAHPYYNRLCAGGEGYMEIGKTIECMERAEAHMVLSLKPFGCLPSTQSDGAQAAVTVRYPELVFVPIETSGEGDVNAHSRVLMALEDAKEKCESELRRVVEATGTSLEDVRARCRSDQALRRPLVSIPKKPNIAGRAANFVAHVGTAAKSKRSGNT